MRRCAYRDTPCGAADAAVAMAPPQPATYRESIFERVGLLGELSTTGYMIVRHITRFPARSGMTVIGIALSLGLLISTLQFFDSITLMIDFFFFRVQRQDVTLRFVELRADPVRAEVARLPGVMRTELHRGVGVKLTHGPRNRRAFILGVDAGSELSQQVDAEGRTIAVPPSGLMLSKRLAQHLEAEPGDLVQVDVLEGHRAREQVRVTRLIDEYVGLAAYMERSALNRITGDGEVADSAWLKIDRSQEGALFARVKETPGVFTVALQHRAYEKFRELLDQNMITMVWFYVGFAAVIAFGVAYTRAVSRCPNARTNSRICGFSATTSARWRDSRGRAGFADVGGAGRRLCDRLRLGRIDDRTLHHRSLPNPVWVGTRDLWLVVHRGARLRRVSSAIVAWRIQTLDLVRVLKTRD